MPASSLFAEMERPTSTPNNNLQNSLSSGSTNSMDDNVALQIALELSKIQFSNDSNSPSGSEPDFGIPGLVDAERAKKSQNMTECVAVPSSEHVAEIVGRQGCKIKALRAKTNTYIKTPVRGEEPVFVVTGRKEDVGSAKREILSAAEHFSQIRACRKNNLNGSMAPGPPTNVPGQVTIQCRVPYRVVGLVVGPKGATIKRIQQTTHTYIVTPSRDKEPVFEVTGLPDSVDQARKEIEAHIAMRTGGGALDGENVNDPMGVSNRHELIPHSLNNLFSSTSSDISSLYKMNTSSLNGFNSMGLNGLNGSLNGTSTLNALNGLSSNLTRSLSPQDLSNLENQVIFGYKNGSGGLGPLNDFHGSNDMTSSSLLNSKIDNSLFSLVGSSNINSSGKLGDINVNGLGNYYGVDEGLGSLGSSMGSSPSFDPAPSSIWGDLGRSLGPTLASSNVSSLSSNMSSLSMTRRSSSVSGASPPSSRLSPSFENHPPARRISSDPAPGAMTSAMSSSGSSPASTPELAAFSSSNYCLPTSAAFSTNTTNDGNSSSSSPTPGGEKRCRSCSDAPVVAALVPCGHNLFCMECAKKMVADGSKCTICFENVTQAIRIYS